MAVRVAHGAQRRPAGTVRRRHEAVRDAGRAASSDDSTFFNPSPQKKSDVILSMDSPGVSFPVLAKKDDPQQRRVQRLNVIYDFDLYVSAQTEDTRNDAHKVTVNEAHAGWQWDGSQNIGGPPDYLWAPADSTVTPPQEWRDLTDGSGPDINRRVANDVISDPNLWNNNWNV